MTSPKTQEKPETIEEAAEEMLDPVRDTLQAITELHKRAEGQLDPHQRTIERITGLVGRPAFLYGTQIFVILWIAANMSLRASGSEHFDAPPFFWLQGFVAITALFVTTIVLITQNRQGHTAERRAQLDLQMSLIVEQKVSKLIVLIEELRRDMPNVTNRHDIEAEKLTETADVHVVIEALEEMLDEAEKMVVAERSAG